MKHILAPIVAVLLTTLCSAQTLQGVEVYEISAMLGQQIYYASHIKAEHMKSAKLMDDEDRAALRGAVGKTGIAMPRLPTPYVDDSCRVQKCKITITTYRDKSGEVMDVAKNEYNGGEDNLMVSRTDDAIACILITEGVSQIYTIHQNVTFPDGAKLVTLQTTRNRPIGVSTVNASGKAMRIANQANNSADTPKTSSVGSTTMVPDGNELDKIKQKAERGDAKAQMELGLHYYEGSGVGKDVVEALKWFKKAAESGEKTAMTIVGFIYLEGDGVEVNLKSAFEWGMKAMRAGDMNGTLICGPALEAKGEYKAAYEIYAMGASRGVAEAVKHMNLIESHLTPSEILQIKSEIGKK